jgi:hypothetical protein
VIDKYNLLAFEMFSEVFKHMPLATFVNDTVLFYMVDYFTIRK